jgi:hypothetical protein
MYRVKKKKPLSIEGYVTLLLPSKRSEILTATMKPQYP